MFPGMDPRAMKQAMKKLGMKQEDLDASAVIIVLEGKRIVFENPSVQKIEMQGQESFQITGSYEEVEGSSEETDIDEDSITTVSEQAGVSKEEAKSALQESNGDIAAAIMKLSGEDE